MQGLRRASHIQARQCVKRARPGGHSAGGGSGVAWAEDSARDRLGQHCKEGSTDAARYESISCASLGGADLDDRLASGLRTSMGLGQFAALVRSGGHPCLRRLLVGQSFADFQPSGEPTRAWSPLVPGCGLEAGHWTLPRGRNGVHVARALSTSGAVALALPHRTAHRAAVGAAKGEICPARVGDTVGDCGGTADLVAIYAGGAQPKLCVSRSPAPPRVGPRAGASRCDTRRSGRRVVLAHACVTETTLSSAQRTVTTRSWTLIPGTGPGIEEP